MSTLPEPHVIGAVLLGAGFSRRFGADKRLQPLYGRTVAEETCAVYTRAFDKVRVVLRPEDDALADRLSALDAEIVTTSQAHLGMGHSLSAGFAGLTWQWAFVGLLDMPFVSADTLTRLIRCAASQDRPAIIRPRLQTAADAGSCLGHPVGWHHSYFEELRQCTGDSGARHLLHKHADATVEVPVDDPGIVQDIDEPADLPQD